MDTKHKVQKITLVSISIICILLSVAQFIGILNSSWFITKSPGFILFILSLIALYSVLDEDRISKKISSIYSNSHEELLNKIALKQNFANLMKMLEFSWQERESEINKFFNDIKEIARYGSNEILIKKLLEYQNAFSIGEISDLKQEYPWDVTIAAIDNEGKFVYHPKSTVINRKPNQKHHQEIMDNRNGELLWINNFPSVQFQKTLSVPEYFNKYVRLTKVYFRELEGKDIIVIFESHLDILYNLPV